MKFCDRKDDTKLFLSSCVEKILEYESRTLRIDISMLIAIQSESSLTRRESLIMEQYRYCNWSFEFFRECSHSLRVFRLCPIDIKGKPHDNRFCGTIMYPCREICCEFFRRDCFMSKAKTLDRVGESRFFGSIVYGDDWGFIHYTKIECLSFRLYAGILFYVLFMTEKYQKVLLLFPHFGICVLLDFLNSKNSSFYSSNSFEFYRKSSMTDSQNSEKERSKIAETYFSSTFTSTTIFAIVSRVICR